MHPLITHPVTHINQLSHQSVTDVIVYPALPAALQSPVAADTNGPMTPAIHATADHLPAVIRR